MEDNYYLCCMRLPITITYFKNIVGANAPELSLGSRISIGSSNSQSSVTVSNELEPKCGGLSLNKSMSQISFCKILNSVIALHNCNYRPNPFLQLPKLSFFRLNLYQTNW